MLPPTCSIVVPGRSISPRASVTSSGTPLADDAHIRTAESKLAALRAGYGVALRAKLQEIASRLAEGERDEAKGLAHKVRGTAGSYGYAEVGLLAGRLEDALEAGEDVAEIAAALVEQGAAIEVPEHDASEEPTGPAVLVLEPDVVVLGLFMANDLQHNLTQVRGARWPHAGWIRRHSALGHLLFLRFLAHSAGTPFSPAPAEEHGIPMNDYVGGELAGYITPVPPTFRLAYQVLEETLRQLGALSREHDFELAVVLVPTLSTLTGELRFPDPEDTRRWSRFDLQPGERIDVGQPTREVMAICARLELVCVDPTEALATHLGADAILEDDDHPTVAAHRLIAAQLYRRLAQEPERFLGLPAR